MSARFIIYFIFLFAVLILGMVSYRKLTIPFKLLVLLIAATVFIEVVAKVCAIRYHNNMPVSHFSSITEYIFFSLIFYFLFIRRSIKRLILASIATVTFFFFINALVLQPYYSTFPSNIILISEVLYAVFSLLLFKQMLYFPSQNAITQQSIFWFNISMLFFSTTMFLNLGLVNYFINHKLNDTLLYDFSFYVNILFYSLLGISIFVNSNENNLRNE